MQSYQPRKIKEQPVMGIFSKITLVFMVVALYPWEIAAPPPLTLAAAPFANIIIVTSSADSGAGTLRQAITDAVSGDTILFNSSMNIYLNNELSIAKNLTIDGGAHNIVISGSNAVRVFNVNSGITFNLSNVTVANGNVSSGNGGGILNQGVLTVTNCALGNNLASPAPHSGGGIYNADIGVLIVISSTFTNNGAAGAGAGILNNGVAQVFSSTFSNGRSNYLSSSGAGIANLGVLTVTNSLFAGNEAPHGAGLSNGHPNSRLVVYSSTFDSNRGRYGAGMDNYGLAEVYNSTFTGNVSDSSFGDDGGGGIYNAGALILGQSTLITNSATTGAGGGIHNSGALTVANSTFSGNSVSLNNGGGLYNVGTLTLTNSTLVGNAASDTFCGGIYNGSGGALHYANTLVANNRNADCVNAGAIHTNIRNFIADGSCSAALFGDPRLAALAPSGVHALLPASPAIDAGDLATCPETDQRGFPRADLGCDMGAFEVQYDDSDTVIRPVVANALTTFGPALVGIRNDGGADDPGIVTVTKSYTWSTKPDNTIDAYWSITPGSGANYNLTLQLCYLPTELNGLSEENLRLWRYSGGSWAQVGIGPLTWETINGNRCAPVSGITGFSAWTLGVNETPTAVSLSSFSAASPVGWVGLVVGAMGVAATAVFWRRRR